MLRYSYIVSLVIMLLPTASSLIAGQVSLCLNEVIPLCINSIYLLYYIIPSTQHTSTHVTPSTHVDTVVHKNHVVCEHTL